MVNIKEIEDFTSSELEKYFIKGEKLENISDATDKILKEINNSNVSDNRKYDKSSVGILIFENTYRDEEAYNSIQREGA